jgi:hypothetical protein
MAIAALQIAYGVAWRHGFSAQCTFAARLWNGVRVSRNRIPARVQSSLIGRAFLHAEITTRFPEADCGQGFIPGGSEHVEFDSCGGLQCLHN